MAVVIFRIDKPRAMGGEKLRTDYIHRQEMLHILAALMPANRLALEISLATGLRIGDVLQLRSDALRTAVGRRLTVRELKTGKRRRVTLPVELYNRALSMAGKVYVFQHRLDYRKPRTRQAVFKDMKRAARMFRCVPNVAPHSARKVYAVEAYHRTGDLKRVQALLNHSEEAVTMLYAMADEVTARRIGAK